MSRTIAGTLLRPDGEPVGGARIFLTAKQNEVASIVSGMDAFFLTESNGSYNQVVVNGWYNVSVEYTLSTAVGPRRWNLGDIFVDSGSTVDLNTLLQVSEAATDPGIVTQIQQWYLEIMAAVPVVEAAKVSAQNSATAAAGSATAASGSATAAASSATAANSSATTASTSATTASNAATTATTAAGTATTKAGEASTSATNAQNSATAAASSAASVAGVVDAAEDARDAAIAAKNDAQSSASGAATSEANAADSATAASGSAGTASTAAGAAVAAADTAIDKADEAADSATAAAGSAGAASTSAGAAASSATAAQGFRDEAESHKDAAAGSATAAANSATAASSSADDAATARGGAEAAETQAEAWATNPVDTPVEPGKFSAFHWATKSEESAATSVANASESADSAAEAQTYSLAAEGARDSAALSATNASDSAVEAASEAGTAVTAREAAELARDDANTAQLAAEAAAGEAGLWENIAMQFAQNPEDVPVVDGDSNPIGFSALHYAAKAEESAAGGITPGTVLDFLTNKVGAPFGNTSTMNQALQALVNSGVGGTSGEAEYLDGITSFAEMMAVPSLKPFCVTGASATATYLASATASSTIPYIVSTSAGRDVFLKLASVETRNAASTQIIRKVYLLHHGQSTVNTLVGLTRMIVLTNNTVAGTFTAQTYSLLTTANQSTVKVYPGSTQISRGGDYGVGGPVNLDSISSESGGSYTTVTPNLVRNAGFIVGRMDQATYKGTGATGNIVTVFGIGGGTFGWDQQMLFCVDQSGRLFAKYGANANGWGDPVEIIRMDTLLQQAPTIKNLLQINSVSSNDFYIASDFVNSVNNGGDFIGNAFNGGAIENPTNPSEFPNNAQGVVKLLCGTTVGSGASILAGYAAGGGGIRSVPGLKASIIFRCPQSSVQNYGFNWGLVTVNSELAGGTSAICVKKEPGSFDLGLLVRYANTGLHNSYIQGMLPNTDYQLTLQIYQRTSDNAVFVRMSIYTNPYSPSPTLQNYEDFNLDVAGVPMGLQYYFGFIATGITGVAETAFSIDFMEVGIKNMQRGINVFNLATP